MTGCQIISRRVSSCCHLECRHCFYNDKSSLSVTVNRQNSQQPRKFYQQLRQSDASSLQFIPLVQRDAQGKLTTESVDSQTWAQFLCAVFDLWVRNDIGRVHIRIFDSMMEAWCGTVLHVDESTLSSVCLNCSVLRFCHGDCPDHRDESGKSVLCAGYKAFIDYSAPHMRVMRDLIRQHRSPAELMAMLRDGR